MKLYPYLNSLRQMSCWPTAPQAIAAAAILAGASILYSAAPNNWKSYTGSLALKGVGFIASQLGLSPCLKKGPSILSNPSNTVRAQVRINRIQGHIATIPPPLQALHSHPTQSSAITNGEKIQEKIYTFFVEDPKNIKAILSTLNQWKGHLKTYTQHLKDSQKNNPDNLDLKTATAIDAEDCCIVLSQILKIPELRNIPGGSILVSVDSNKHLLSCAFLIKNESDKTFIGGRLISNPFNNKILHPEISNQIRGGASSLFDHVIQDKRYTSEWQLKLDPYSRAVPFYKALPAQVSDTEEGLLLKNANASGNRYNHEPLMKEIDIL